MEKINIKINNLDQVKNTRNTRIKELIGNPIISKMIAEGKITQEDIYNNPYIFIDFLNNLNLCYKCEGIDNCIQKKKGFYLDIENDDYLSLVYKPCKYYKENKIKNTTKFFETPKSLMQANLRDLITEKERSAILKYIKNFLKKKLNNEQVKGLYFSGSFGSGKSYILSALLNELSNNGFNTVNVYYPSLLKKLKMSFNNYSYDDVLDEIIKADVLLIDDIGAENNSEWARDEVLGTILQYRMDNNLTTFFTSNYTIDELEEFLAETSKGTDKIKARRIIERIKCLAEEEKLISKNKRN